MSINNKGSLTVETALIFPAVMSVILFGYACIMFFVNYFTVSLAFDATAEQLSDYAYIYHEKIISGISNNVQTSVKTEVDSALDNLLNRVPSFITELVDVKGYIELYEDDLLDKAADQIYMPIANLLFRYNYSSICSEKKIADENAVLMNEFSKSEFFHDNNEIILEMNCNLKFPLIFFNNSGIKMNYKIKMNAWINGVGKEEEGEEITEDIWSLSNFDRGKRIRKLYNANLPDTFPVISAFRNGRAVMIKSLDCRKDTYLKDGAMSRKVKYMFIELDGFKGQEKPFGKDGVVVRQSDIRERELILVIPKEDETELIKSELIKCETLAKSYGIIFSVKRL